MPDPINDLMNFATMNVAGLPIVVWILLIGGIIYLAYRFGSNANKFKKKLINHEVKANNDNDVNAIGVNVNRKLFYHNYLGNVTKMTRFKEKPTIIKDKRGKLVVAQSRYDMALARANIALHELAKVGTIDKALQKERDELARIVESRRKNVYLLKVIKDNLISVMINKVMPFGVTYYMVDDDMLDITSEEITINNSADHTNFCGVQIFSKSAREAVENIAFKINREAELEAWINYIPKMEYLETDVSRIASAKREDLKLYQEKYKSQSETGGR